MCGFVQQLWVSVNHRVPVENEGHRQRDDGEEKWAPGEEKEGLTDDDWGMMKRPWDVSRRSLSSQGWPPYCSLQPLVYLLLPLYIQRWHILLKEFRNAFFFLLLDRNSEHVGKSLLLSLSLLCGALLSFRLNNTRPPQKHMLTTAVQPPVVILRRLELHWKLHQTYFCSTAWPRDHLTYYEKWKPQKQSPKLWFGSHVWSVNEQTRVVREITQTFSALMVWNWST